MKRYVIAGNWKMNLNKEELKAFFRAFSVESGMLSETELHRNSTLNTQHSTLTKIICPVFPLLPIAIKESANSGIQIGAQNVSQYDKGAYTGEVSANILKSIEIPYCIIGHSERRQYFDETDEIIREKWLRLRAEGINPIICIGETLTERENGDTFKVIKKQIETIFANPSSTVGLRETECTPTTENRTPNTEDLLIAYEPVWAIGTGKTATPEMAQEVHQYIRTLLTKIYGDSTKDIPLLYGGSVKPSNIKDLLSMPDINGALIGGASLDPKDFYEMTKIAEQLLSPPSRER